MSSKKRLPFDKYELYMSSVQSPETDVVFFRKVYRKLRHKDPVVLREDFCGTFALSRAWTHLAPQHQAIGIDVDPEPIAYGRRLHKLEKQTDEESKRIRIFEKDVLSGKLPSADISVAMNFSYFIFQTRPIMKKYFQNVFRSLNKDGVFLMDIFGGSDCYGPNEENTPHKKFIYYWDQRSFDPITNRALFFIHYRVKGQKKRERVFKYDWRMWSIPEIRDLLNEVGFKNTHVYWEGTTRRGGGNGVFTKKEKGESCQSWIAYIAAEKP